MVKHWIPVTDRLPESGQRVIVCRKDGRVEQGVYLGVNGWWKVYGTNTKSITHWMPMPEPPHKGLSRGDLIRRMDDQELARYLYEVENSDLICKFCQNKPECERLIDADDGIPEGNCIDCLVMYLQQPVNEEE